MDSKLRELERKARAGDPDAQVKLAHEMMRALDVLEVVGKLSDSIQQAIAARFQSEALAEDITEHLDYGALASAIDPANLASELDYSALMGEVDMSYLAGELDVSTSEIASEICTSDVASELDMTDLADHIALADVAQHVDIEQLAALIDPDDIANRVRDLMESE